MKSISTQKTKQSKKIKSKLEPKESTLRFILKFAATYEASKVKNKNLPGSTLN